MLFQLKPKEIKTNINGFEVVNTSVELHQELFNSFYKEIKVEDSNYLYPIIFNYINNKNKHHFIIDGYLFHVRFYRDVITLINTPINERCEIAPLDFVIEVMNKLSIGKQFKIADYSHTNKLVQDGLGDLIKGTRSSYGKEYIYDNEIVGSLSGSQFSNLRKDCNKFRNRVNYEVIPYTSKLFNEASGVYDDWLNKAGKKYKNHWDIKLFNEVIRNCDKIDNMHGFLVLDKDTNKYIGYFDTYIVSDSFASGVTRKTDSDYKGLGVFCQSYVSEFLHSKGIKFINDGNDGGLKGLGVMKSRFHPVQIHSFKTYKRD